MTYTVAVSRAGEALVQSDDRLIELSIALEYLHASVAADDSRLTVRLTVEADDIGLAIEEAVTAIDRGLEIVGLPDLPVIGIEAVEWDEFERKLEEPTYPRLVGITEIAELIGVTRQRASALARSSRFPVPAAELASGPVWFESNIARFAEQWDRKPGRPSKKILARDVASDAKLRAMGKANYAR